MHPQILRTWPRGRQTLAIRAHNLLQNNGKRNVFAQNWSENYAKRIGYKISTICFICTCRRQDDQNWYSLSADLMKCSSKSIFRTRRVRSSRKLLRIKVTPYLQHIVKMDGWVRVLRPFNSISVISRRWKGEHERLCAMKRRLGSGRISPPAGFEPATP